MATEVGALNASLTLDLSDFQAGIAEAASLAQQLGAQLRAAFNGDVGISRMAAQVREAMEAIKLLRAELQSFQALQNSESGADIFAQMRTHTAALPAEINAIQSALTGAVTAAQQLSAAMQSVATAANQASTAARSISFNNTGTPSWDFSVPLSQLQQMAALSQQMLSALKSIGTVDLKTGEVTGGDQLIQINNLVEAYKQIAGQLEKIIQLLGRANTATQEWLKTTQSAMRSLSGISASIQQVISGFNGAAKGGKNLNNQVKQVNKNLQTTHGYAINVQGILGGIVISQAFYSLLNIMEDLVNGSIEFSQNMQDAGVAFGYLMRDAEVSSEAFLNALKDIALVSPLDTTDLTSAARQLMAMGFSAESTIPALQILTDTAAVFSNGAGDMSNMISHIALAFGQMIAAGKVSAQELRQLYNAGLPVYELLSEGLGISMEMAKNAGHYNIDSAEAVYAILMQLQERYGGAAEALAQTMSGSLEVIRESLQQLLSYAWAPAFDVITEGLNKVAKYFQALVKITQAYGVGGLFQAIFPESMWNVLRRCISGIMQVVDALRILGQAIASIVGGALRLGAQIGSVVLPVVGLLAGMISRLAVSALQAAPWLRTLLEVIVLLTISGVVAKGVILLAKAIYTLTGAKAVIKVLAGLASTIVAVASVHPVLVIALTAIAAAFLAIVASSEKARAAIARFFGGIGSSISDFSQDLGFGFDPDDIAMPEFDPPDTSDFSDGLNDMISGMEDLGDAEEETGEKAKKAKKNIQSFDEVYQIEDPEESDGGLGDTMDNMLDALKGIGNLDYSDMFDWTGDWATDWGNLTADLGAFGDGLTDTFADISASMEKFWSALTGGGTFTDAMAVFDLLSGILALLGKTKWAGALQVIEGITKIAEALRQMATEGINFDNIMLLISGLGDIATGLGLITGNVNFVGIGLLLSGLSETFVALKNLVTEGIDIAGILDVIEGLGKIAAGVGILQKNAKLAGAGLIVTGLTSIIGELAENWDAIRKGDWSGVDKVALAVGAIETLSGVILAIKGFSAIASTANTAKNAADVAEGASAAASAASGVDKATKGIKTVNWATIGKVIAGIAAGLAVVIAAVALIGLLDTANLEKGTTNATLIGQAFLELAPALGLTLAGAVGIGAILNLTPINFTDILVGLAAIDVGIADMVAMVALLGLIDTPTIEKGTANIKLAAEAFMALEMPLDLLLVKAGVIGAIIIASSGLGALALGAGILAIDAAIVDIVALTAAAAAWDTATLQKGANSITLAFEALRQIEGPLDRLIAVAGAVGAIVVASLGLGAIAFASGLAVIDSTIATIMYWLKQYSTWDTAVLEAGGEKLDLAFTAFSKIEGPLTRIIDLLERIGSHTNNLFGLFDYDYEGAFEILSNVMDSLLKWMEAYSTWDTTKLETGSNSIMMATSAGEAIVSNITPLIDILDNIGGNTNNLFGLGNYDYDGAFDILSGVMDQLILWMESYSTWDTTKLESGSTSIDLAGQAGQTIVDVLQPLMDMLNDIGVHTNNLFGLGDYDYDGAFTILKTVMDSFITWMGDYATWDTTQIESGGVVMSAAGTAGQTVVDALSPLMDMLNNIGVHTNNIFGIGDYDYEGAFTILSTTMNSLITWVGGFAEWNTEALTTGATILESVVPTLDTLNTSFPPLLDILNSIGQQTNNIFGIGDYDYEGALNIVINSLSTIIEALETFGQLDSKGVNGGIALLTDLEDALGSLTAVADGITSIGTDGLPGVGEDLKSFANATKEAFDILSTAPYDVVDKLVSSLESLDLTKFTNIGVNAAKALTQGLNEYKPNTDAFGTSLITGVQTGVTNAMLTMPTFLLNTVSTPIHSWFKQYFDSTLYETYGTALMEGVKTGIKAVMLTLAAWLLTNVNAPYHNWFKQYFASVNFETYGENIVRGMMQGIDNMAPEIWAKVDAICAKIMRRIKAALQMHSPSRFTMWCGEMLMEGMSIGITDNARLAYQAATAACSDLTQALTPEEVQTADMFGGIANTSLSSLASWSDAFISTIDLTLNSVASLFEDFNTRIEAATAGIQSVPTSIDANIKPIAAAEQLQDVERSCSVNTPTGTPEVQQVLAQLTAETVEMLSSKVAQHIYEYLAPIFATMTDEDQQRTIAYVGTLIADDRGLKELERKLYKIRQNETTRR